MAKIKQSVKIRMPKGSTTGKTVKQCNMCKGRGYVLKK